MPVNEEDEYDFNHIEKLIKNSYGSEEIKQFL